eukprot:jgi/Tetstr1/428850/TSEL_018837.t1
MGVGEDPVGEDGMDIDAPAWPPADVEAADEGVIRKGDPGDFYMKVIAKKFRGVWHYGVITGVVTEWVLEDYGRATQWRAVFEDGDIVDLLRSEASGPGLRAGGTTQLRLWLRGGWRERSLARLDNPLSPISRLDHGLLRLLTRRTRRIIVAWQGFPPRNGAVGAPSHRYRRRHPTPAGLTTNRHVSFGRRFIRVGAPWQTSPPGQKWAASLVVSRVRAAGIEEDEKDMRKRVTRGRPDAKVRKLMAASSTAQPPGVVKTLTDDKKRKRPVKKRGGKKLTVAESEAEAEAQAEAEAEAEGEAEAEAARSSKRRVPRARKNKNKQ